MSCLVLAWIDYLMLVIKTNELDWEDGQPSAVLIPTLVMY